MLSRRSQLSFLFSPILLLVVGALEARASAQCSTQWLAGPGVPGTDGWVQASTWWDPDGPGPLGQVLVIGGTFTVAGTVLANNIATYDPVSGAWSALGSGMGGGMWGRSVNALTTLPNGDLVAGGNFTTAGGISANYIARWNGTSWSPLGSGMGGSASHAPEVYALTALPNGDVVAGGRFTTAGGVSANYIARWNGTSWSALPGVSALVSCLATLPNGDLVAGGIFTSPASYVARWNGTSWSALGTGLSGFMGEPFNPFRTVHALVTLPNGDLVASGCFTAAGGVTCNGIARWNGASWSALGSGFGGYQVGVPALAILPNGDLVAGGRFDTAGGVIANNIARWNGTSWSALGTGVTTSSAYTCVNTVAALPNGDVVAGGYLVNTAGGVAVSSIARWNGTSWSALGGGTAGIVRAFAQLPNGDVVMGGYFTSVGGVSANRIARWDGTSWSALGSGLSWSGTTVAFVNALTTLPNGDIVAGGSFNTAGGVSAFGIARWDGTTWSPLGSGISAGYVFALTTLPNGDVVAGGDFYFAGGTAAGHVARWDGTSWSAMGTGLTGSQQRVNALTTLANGDLVAGGSFSNPVSNIARWNGTNWSALGPGLTDQVTSLLALPNGDLVAGGHFPIGLSAIRIARWNGLAWSALGSGTNGAPAALTRLPNGDLLAGGDFTVAGGVGVNCIARWNGTSWLPLGSGMSGGMFGSAVYALSTLPNGDLAAGGNFTIVNGAISAYLARLTTTCPAAAVSSGAGCSGAGGPNVLTATTLPWAGAAFRSEATGMPGLGLAIDLRGFSTLAIPMPAILPQGVPGCSLLVSLDLCDFLVPIAGSVQTQMVIPNTMALASQVFHQQIAALELDPLLNITAVTSSNALSLTIGFF